MNIKIISIFVDVVVGWLVAVGFFKQFTNIWQTFFKPINCGWSLINTAKQNEKNMCIYEFEYELKIIFQCVCMCKDRVNCNKWYQMRI